MFLVFFGQPLIVLCADESYPQRFLHLCGLRLPEHNDNRIGGQDINPGSDAEEYLPDKAEEEEEEEEEDPEELLRHLNSLHIEEAAETPQRRDQPAASNTPAAVSALQRRIITLANGQDMRVWDFCQLGRTVGAEEFSQTRDMMTVQVSVPGGTQVNSLDVTIMNEPNKVKLSWDYHPGLFMAHVVAKGALKRDRPFLDSLQTKLNKESHAIIEKNGRLGESLEYTLTDVPSGKRISMLEGFINPFTFLPPEDSDCLSANKITFNQLDNTSNAVILSFHLLVEKERTQLVRRNRYRNVEETLPEIESLPLQLLLQLTAMLDTSGGQDNMDVDHRRNDEGRSAAGRRVASRSNNASSPRSRQQQQQQQQQAPNVIQEDGGQLPSLAELMQAAAAAHQPVQGSPNNFFDTNQHP